MSNTTTFQLSPQADPNKVFLVNLSETEERLDPHCYHKERVATIEALKKSGRKIKKLRDVVSFQNALTKNILEETEYVGLENIESNIGLFTKYGEKESISSAKVFKKGQILFPRLRPLLNKVYLAEFNGISSTEFYVLENKGELSNEYLSHYLRSNLVVNQTKHLTSGHTLPRLQTEDVENLPVPILSPHEQEKVINLFQRAYTAKRTAEAEAQQLLNGIDTYILNELGITLPEADNSLANRVFFTNFSEVSGGRFDPLFYTQSFIEQVKKGYYPLETLGHLIEYAITGFAAGRLEQSQNEEDIIQIRPTNIDNDRNLRFDKNIYIDKQQLVKRTGDILKNGEVLFNNTNSQEMIGKTVLFNLDKPHFCSNHITRVKTKESLNSLFLTYIINIYQRQQVFYKICTNWNNQSGVNASVLAKIQIPLPDLTKQHEIADTAQTMRQKAQDLMKSGKAILEQTKREVEAMILNI